MINVKQESVVENYEALKEENKMTLFQQLLTELITMRTSQLMKC